MPTNLLIPNKNAIGYQYKQDMQTLEQWARQPIQQLIAGSGVTLSPSSGLATDSSGNGPHPVTISAAGGGGGTPVQALLGCGPDNTGTLAYPYPIGPMSSAASGGALGPFNSPWPLWSNSSGSVIEWPCAASWMVDVGAGTSIALLPSITIPNFTGAGSVIVYFTYYAVSFDFLNQAGFGLTHTFTSGSTYQFTAADCTAYTGPVGDPTLVDGTGSGTGIISNAGDIPYMCGVDGYISVENGVTFS